MLFATLNDDEPPGGPLFFEPLKRPKRKNTSEQVTKMDMMMRIMIIHVMSMKERWSTPIMHVGEVMLTGHFRVSDCIAQDFGQIKEDAAALIQHLNARLDLQVLPNCRVKWVKRGFTVPEKVWNIKNIRRCEESAMALSKRRL